MNNELKVIREVNNQAENSHPEAVALGLHAAYTLKASHRSQMTGLENIAESSFKTSDIFDYVKRQTARFSHWRQTYPGQSEISFGERLREQLEQTLLGRVNIIARRLSLDTSTDEGKQELRRIHLLLIRQFIRSMVVNYEYYVSPISSNGNQQRGGR